MNTLFAEHITTLRHRYDRILHEQAHDALLIAAGHPKRRFLDDTCYPFRANPHFLAWVPLTDHPHCWLLIEPDRKPKLFYHMPTDFWHLTPELPTDDWTRHFDITPFSDLGELRRVCTRLRDVAFIGEDAALAQDWGLPHINPPDLLHALHYERAIKTPYEQACVQAANRLACRGHNAAATLFHEGASEYAIQLAYLQAMEQNERDMPYDNIVALNEHAATLHYQFYQSQPPEQHRTLLIDAGAQYHGYAADITRTHTRDNTQFQALIEALDTEQQRLIGRIKPGVDFVDLHLDMHRAIAGLLKQFDIVRAPVEQQLEQGMTRAFFPHGLGHFLGLQVHDVGGQQKDAKGHRLPPPSEHPFLRLTRTLETGHVITVEPGLYFIPSLLAELKADQRSKLVNWPLIDQLLPFGGIRIEDNVCVTAEGCDNYTREAFA